MLSTIEEISRLFADSPSDKEVARVLDEMGSYRDPGDGPTAHIDWLTEVRATLSDSQKARRPA